MIGNYYAQFNLPVVAKFMIFRIVILVVGLEKFRESMSVNIKAKKKYWTDRKLLENAIFWLLIIKLKDQ